MPRLLSFQPFYGLCLCEYAPKGDQTNMKDTEKTKIIWREWGAFCDLLLEGTRACDSGKSWPDYLADGQYPESDYSKALDEYLRLSFEPPTDGLPPGIFAETPPVLEKALAERIAHATVLLTRMLEKYDGPEIHSESDLIAATRLAFRDLLLPSPPKPGDYTWKKNV
jgi:hypothetical protein